MLAIAPAGIAAALAAEQVHYVLAGEVAGAVHGWRLRSTAGSFYWSQTTTPRIFKPSSERLAYSARAAESWTIPSAGFDPRWRWSLPSGQQLVASVGPAGAHGYRDLLRDAEAVTLGAALVNVASLRDLIRLADASPRERERAFTPALWTTLDQTRLAERKAA